MSKHSEEKKMEIIEEIRNIKVTEAPDEKEFGGLSKGQIFLAGQINVLMRIAMITKKLQGGKNE